LQQASNSHFFLLLLAISEQITDKIVAMSTFTQKLCF